MNVPHTQTRWSGAASALLLASGLLVAAPCRAAGEEVGVEVKPVQVERLLNVQGKTLTAVAVFVADDGAQLTTFDK
jgi:hypothetical protein